MAQFSRISTSFKAYPWFYNKLNATVNAQSTKFKLFARLNQTQRGLAILWGLCSASVFHWQLQTHLEKHTKMNCSLILDCVGKNFIPWHAGSKCPAVLCVHFCPRELWLGRLDFGHTTNIHLASFPGRSFASLTTRTQQWHAWEHYSLFSPDSYFGKAMVQHCCHVADTAQ